MTDATLSLVGQPAMTAQPAGPASPAPPAASKIGLHNRFPLWVGGVAMGLGVAATAVYLPQVYVQQTNDAYVQADTVSVTPKIAGYVTALHVTDNSRFKAGQLLAEIDPRDFQVAVDSAEAGLQTAHASKTDVLQQLGEQGHLIAAAQATIDSDRATLQFANQQLARYAKLATDGAATAERWQQAQSEIGEHKASLDHDVAALAAAQARIGVLQSQAEETDGAIARQAAALAQARLNLSYTKIYATADGSVANRTVQVGNYVQPGQVLFSAVPREAFVLANFKETQLAHMRVGQPVTVKVDALGGERVRGHVDSFQRGTGSNFALLPPENATGNFVKVVQRIPVKIVLDGPPQALDAIAPGMSVEASAEINAAPAWLKWLF